MTDSTQRFGDRVDAYAAHRPGYPQGAIDAVFAGLDDPKTLMVADLGAGTGISSRLLADRGARVIAVEPNAKMRAAAEMDPRVEWRDGIGEATGLATASVDIATAFQAFHWFATPAGLAEMRRIARRRAVLVQYERDATDPFTAAYGEVVEHHALDDTEERRAEAMRTFAAFPGATITRASFSSAQHMNLEGLLGRAASSSYLPQTGDANKALQRDIRAVYDRFAGLAGLSMMMTTFVIVADLANA